MPRNCHLERQFDSHVSCQCDCQYVSRDFRRSYYHFRTNTAGDRGIEDPWISRHSGNFLMIQIFYLEQSGNSELHMMFMVYEIVYKKYQCVY